MYNLKNCNSISINRTDFVLSPRQKIQLLEVCVIFNLLYYILTYSKKILTWAGHMSKMDNEDSIKQCFAVQ